MLKKERNRVISIEEIVELRFFLGVSGGMCTCGSYLFKISEWGRSKDVVMLIGKCPKRGLIIRGEG